MHSPFEAPRAAAVHCRRIHRDVGLVCDAAGRRVERSAPARAAQQVLVTLTVLAVYRNTTF